MLKILIAVPPPLVSSIRAQKDAYTRGTVWALMLPMLQIALKAIQIHRIVRGMSPAQKEVKVSSVVHASMATT